MPMNPRLMRPLARRQAPSAFSPDSITGLVAWYDASDAATLFQNSDGTTAAGDADPVGYWGDKKGMNHLTQTTNNNRPVVTAAAQNGKAAVTFDGITSCISNSGLLLSSAPEFSLFAVIKYADPEGAFGISVAFPGTDQSGSPFYGAATLEINRSGVGVGAYVGSLSQELDAVAYTASAAPATAFVHGSVFANEAIGLLVNGSEEATEDFPSAAYANAGFYLGAYVTNIVNIACDICEVAYYSRGLTSSEIEQLQSHWATKWGLS